MVCTARITILASRLAAGVVNFDSSEDVVISAADAGAPVPSTRAVMRVVRGPGVYGTVNVPFQVVIQGSSGSDAVVHVTPSSGVVTLLDRQVYHINHFSFSRHCVTLRSGHFTLLFCCDSLHRVWIKNMPTFLLLCVCQIWTDFSKKKLVDMSRNKRLTKLCTKCPLILVVSTLRFYYYDYRFKMAFTADCRRQTVDLEFKAAKRLQFKNLQRNWTCRGLDWLLAKMDKYWLNLSLQLSQGSASTYFK